MIRIAIVGAGPAGISAASVLAGHGDINVTLFDEAPRPGGQIFRQPHAQMNADMKTILGPDLTKYQDFHRMAQETLPRIDYRPDTAVWNLHEKSLQLISDNRLDEFPFDILLIATGATDRLLPVAGWNLPGVYALGGAQIILKEQGCLIGSNVVFCGSSPLLYLAAVQYQRAGGRVAAVLDTTPFLTKASAAGRLMAQAKTFSAGLRLIAQLKRTGVPILNGVELDAFEGTDHVQGVRFRTSKGQARTIDCDAVGLGFGLRAETQLAEIGGVKLSYDQTRRQWYPQHDREGRCGDDIYVAGDGARAGGADAALLSGKRAAWAILRDRGYDVSGDKEMAGDLRQLQKCYTFQDGIARAFSWPEKLVGQLDDDVVLCRCENVTVGQARASLRLNGGPSEANRAKAATRCGMGRCQGRFCGAALAELVNQETGNDGPRQRLRAQPPIKPLPLSAVAQEPVE